MLFFFVFTILFALSWRGRVRRREKCVISQAFFLGRKARKQLRQPIGSHVKFDQNYRIFLVFLRLLKFENNKMNLFELFKHL